MDSEASVSERRYRLLRKQLDELGYLNTLPIEALPLVERLISDLLHTTESLRHYKEIAQKSLEERVYFANGVEPYKQENAKLVRELNDLHIKYLKSKEEIEKQQKEFKSQIRKLQSENSDLQFLSSQHLLQVKELEKESTEKTLTILRLQNKSAQPVVINPGGKKAPLRTRPTLEIDAPLDPPKTWKDQFWTATAQVKDPYIANMVETCDERICLLSRENLKLRRKLNEQDQEIVKLHQCIQDLNYEKQNLQKRIDGKIISAVARSAMTSPVMEGPGQSVRIATETQVTEHARLEKTIMESEDRVRRLELERRELMATTGVQKATINNLEDELETLREKFNGSQMELTQQRTLYTQIKSLQDQTDRALADSQGQLAQLEAELANSRDRVRVLESDRASLDREVSSLKTEQTVLRGNIAQVDQEKDALLMSIDSKTEQIAQLERQLKLIENKCVDLEGNVAELQRKLDISLEESAAREQALRAAAREAEVLRAELQTLERARDGLLRENRFM
ncbi:Centrosomal protein of 135 kDa [Gryllus bimaculatus]|nr:Centrosomal protein of 135 kDa [Gryllus bimaculatus]